MTMGVFDAGCGEGADGIGRDRVLRVPAMRDGRVIGLSRGDSEGTVCVGAAGGAAAGAAAAVVAGAGVAAAAEVGGAP